MAIAQASSRRFYPTRLATTLTSSLPPLPTSDAAGASAQAQGFIILETNYRIYAYTGMLLTDPIHYTHSLTKMGLLNSIENPLQTAVLNLFATLKYRFPNLVVGSLTRESVRKALTNGITADQVHFQAYDSGVQAHGVLWHRLSSTYRRMLIHKCARMQV